MSSRKPAPRIARPAARYRKGQAPKGFEAAQSDSEDDAEIEEQEQPEDEGDVLIRDVERDDDDEEEDEDSSLAVHKGAAKPAKGTISVALRDVNISREGKVIVGGKEESGRTAAELEEGAF